MSNYEDVILLIVSGLLFGLGCGLIAHVCDLNGVQFGLGAIAIWASVLVARIGLWG